LTKASSFLLIKFTSASSFAFAAASSSSATALASSAGDRVLTACIMAARMALLFVRFAAVPFLVPVTLVLRSGCGINSLTTATRTEFGVSSTSRPQNTISFMET